MARPVAASATVVSAPSKSVAGHLSPGIAGWRQETGAGTFIAAPASSVIHHLSRVTACTRPCGSRLKKPPHVF